VPASVDPQGRFAARAAAVFQTLPDSGRYFESVAPGLIARGGKYSVRKLDETAQKCEEEWPQLKMIYGREVTELSDALVRCNDPSEMYSLDGGRRCIQQTHQTSSCSAINVRRIPSFSSLW